MRPVRAWSAAEVPPDEEIDGEERVGEVLVLHREEPKD